MSHRHALRTYAASLLTGQPWRSPKCLRVPLACATVRHGTSGSSHRWVTRQQNDHFSKQAKLQGLRARAAWKLFEINAQHGILKRGMTVVDLGYAPGSWSQVAYDYTKPGGRVIGIDLIPARPPPGVSSIQGNFLSPGTRAKLKEMLLNPVLGQPASPVLQHSEEGAGDDSAVDPNAPSSVLLRPSLSSRSPSGPSKPIDVVLSDMSEPWPLGTNAWSRSLTSPHRLMNTSGNAFKDHAGSMDLCNEALRFCLDSLKPGGTFVCKFYQGTEDKLLEKRLRTAFSSVHRSKPASSRQESRECFFVALKMKSNITPELVFVGNQKEDAEPFKEVDPFEEAAPPRKWPLK